MTESRDRTVSIRGTRQFKFAHGRCRDVFPTDPEHLRPADIVRRTSPGRLAAASCCGARTAFKDLISNLQRPPAACADAAFLGDFLGDDADVTRSHLPTQVSRRDPPRVW
jgi:hypothetical protein